MAFIPCNNEQPTLFDFDAIKEKGLDLQDTYNSADPFPHIVIEDFLPAETAEMCLTHFPTAPDADSQSFDRPQERYKTSYQPDYLAPPLRNLFYAFNSRPFIKVIENITGITGLIGDPYFVGGGFHETRNGGHLDVHADFNHHKLMNLERRINLLIYLNRDWNEDYGGLLELWRPDMSEAVQKIVPKFNRAAMFTTTGDSMHGHPHPVNHPSGVSRKSIALYYYTATWREDRSARTTQFRPRPQSDDKTDWKVRSDEFINDFLPPALGRQVMRVKRRLEKTR